MLKTSEFHNNRPVKDDVDDFQKKHQEETMESRVVKVKLKVHNL